jgi:hypothetical protein
MNRDKIKKLLNEEAPQQEAIRSLDELIRIFDIITGNSNHTWFKSDGQVVDIDAVADLSHEYSRSMNYYEKFGNLAERTRMQAVALRGQLRREIGDSTL